jgi:hemerythrin-like domain-containing protein
MMAEGQPLSALRRDHVNCGRLLGVVRAQLDCVDAGEALDWELLGRVMRYLFEFGHLFHHRIEDLIYDRLRQRAGAARLTLDAIAEQHRTLEQQTSACRLMIAAAGVDGSQADLVWMLRTYVDELETHMHAEEHSLYPLVELLFKPADWSAVQRELARPLDPLFDAPVQDCYLRILARLGA